MSTPAVTGLSISIGPGMEVTVSAADWDAEGHLFAFQNLPLSVEQLRAIASIVGLEAVAGVERRIQGELRRAREMAKTADARVTAAQRAAAVVASLEAQVAPS